MTYIRKLTPEQHTALIEMSKRGVKLKRLAREFGLGSPSSAWRYKWSKPLPLTSEAQHENNSNMQTESESIDSRNAA